AAVLAFSDDHNDFDGQVYVTRQTGGPGLLAGVDALAGASCPSVPADFNPGRVASDPEVVDFSHDAQVLRRVTVQTDAPFDITAIDYNDSPAGGGGLELEAAISVSAMNDPPAGGFHWFAYFTANGQNGLFDRGQSFFLEASTDPRDGATPLAPLFYYGTSARRPDGPITNTRIGTAAGGEFDAVEKTIRVRIGLDAVNAVAEPDIGPGSRLIGLRG